MKPFLKYSIPEGLIDEQPDIRGLATKIYPGEKGQLVLWFTQRDALFFRLWIYTNLEIAEEQKTEIRHILGLLRRTIGNLKLKREAQRVQRGGLRSGGLLGGRHGISLFLPGNDYQSPTYIIQGTYTVVNTL
jgi:hypothetical protein